MPLKKDVSLNDLAKKTIGWNGAEIESACRRAGLNAIKRNYKEKDGNKMEIIKEDFEKAIKEVGKAINKLPPKEKKSEKKEVKSKK